MPRIFLPAPCRRCGRPKACPSTRFFAVFGASASGLRARSIAGTGTPYKEIIATAALEHADLIVMGTQGRGGLDRALLGSVAERIIRLGPCPVLTVRGTE